jgi:predicted deacylase
MKVSKVPIRTTPASGEVFIQSYFFKGKRATAPKVYLQSSVHGAELQGNAVIFHLIDFFKKNPPEGDITLVPVANPVGMDRKTGEYTDGRFDSTTGENWNRAYFNAVIEKESQREDEHQFCLENLKTTATAAEFKSKMLRAIQNKKKTSLRFAQRLALTLQEMAAAADLVLDLHNANISVPHLYSADSTLADSIYFGIPFVIAIPTVFAGALDEAILAPWALFQKFKKEKQLSAQSYTLELGSQEQISLAAGFEQAQGILQYLIHQGAVRGKLKKPASARYSTLKNYRTVYAPQGGLYEFVHELGTPARAGEVLATCLNFDSQGGKLTTIPAGKDFLPLLRYSSSAVGEGDELLKGLTDWQTLKP